MIVKNPTYVKVEVPAPSKFDQLINGTITTVTAEDLAGVTQINDYAFYNQSNLSKIEIPNSIVYIGKGVFYGTHKLTQGLFLPPTIQVVGSNVDSLFQYTYFKKIKFGGILNATISYYLIREAKNTEAVEFNEGTAMFANNVFQSAPTTLKKVIFPSTTAEIRNIAYTGLTILKSEYPPTKTVSTTFSQLYVPYTGIDRYKSETNWSATASTTYPLVKSETDLSSIDTTLYTKACVIGNDLGIEDDNNYALYNYTNGEWVKE